MHLDTTQQDMVAALKDNAALLAEVGAPCDGGVPILPPQLTPFPSPPPRSRRQ